LTLACQVLLAFVTSHQRQGSFAGKGEDLVFALLCNVPRCALWLWKLAPRAFENAITPAGLLNSACHFAPLGPTCGTSLSWVQGKQGE